MFMAPLVMFAQMGSNQDVHQEGSEQNNHCIHTMECHLAKTRNDLSRHEETRLNLKFISLSERGQSRKAIYLLCAPIVRNSGKGENRDNKQLISVLAGVVGRNLSR